MTQQIINPTPSAREVAVIDPQGNKTTVFIQPGSKAKLAPDYKICPDFASRNPDIRVRELN
jgi:hypothetical protein